MLLNPETCRTRSVRKRTGLVIRPPAPCLMPIFTMNQVGDRADRGEPDSAGSLLEMPFEVGDFVNIIGTLEMDAKGPSLPQPIFRL